MYQIDREIQDIDVIDAFYGVIEIVLKGYNEPIKDGFSKKSRSEQIGYDVTNYLMENQFIHVGQYDTQHRLDFEKKEA